MVITFEDRAVLYCSECDRVHFRVLTDGTDLNRAASFVGGSYEPVVAVVIAWISRFSGEVNLNSV